MPTASASPVPIRTKGNDNCYVESKNWTLVRRCLGYRRFDTEGQLADLQQLETLLARRTNVLQPSMALLEKVRTGKHPSPWTKGLGGGAGPRRGTTLL